MESLSSECSPPRSAERRHLFHPVPVLVAGMAFLTVAPLSGQAPDRLWGEVVTASGERHTGYLRWDRDDVGWHDLVEGERELDTDLQDRIAVALGDELATRERSVEFLGVRISWDDDTEPTRAGSAIRFGHLTGLRTRGDEGAVLLLRDGSEVEFRASGSDLGPGVRGVVVEVPGGEITEFAWRDLDRVRFAAVPDDVAAPDAFRLHGTVVDRWGEEWTGYLAWDRDEALSSDLLEGDEGGEEREVRFELIASIDRRFEGGARIRLRNGTELVLTGSNDVDEGHRGVQVFDPDLGRVDVPWASFSSVRFHSPTRARGYDDVPLPGPLVGSVTTEDGAAYRGRIVWDADEAMGWEMLNGEHRGLGFNVEFLRIRSIVKATSRSVRVTLTDGRTLELSGSNDVDRGNKGIVVEGDDGTFRVIPWRSFARVDFEEAR